jgi:hypothetical protein
MRAPILDFLASKGLPDECDYEGTLASGLYMRTVRQKPFSLESRLSCSLRVSTCSTVEHRAQLALPALDQTHISVGAGQGVLR